MISRLEERIVSVHCSVKRSVVEEDWRVISL
jgi:hypothetical protein